MTTPNDASDSRIADCFARSLGWAIKLVRTERGWSRKDLAERAGVSYSYLTQIENGRTPPSSPVLVRIAEALGLRPSDLLARAESASANARGRGTLQSADGTPPVIDEGDPERTFVELRELVDRMSPGDRERLLDLARRLAK